MVTRKNNLKKIFIIVVVLPLIELKHKLILFTRSNKMVDIKVNSDSGKVWVHNANATLASFLSLLLNFI